MNPSLLVLTAVALGITCAVVSALIRLGLPALDHFASQLNPRERARVWLVVAAIPALVAGTSLAVSLFPALGIGHDHCLGHSPHHPHLCPIHPGPTPGAILAVGAALAGLRVLLVVLSLVKTLVTSQRTTRLLEQGSEALGAGEDVGELRVFEAPQPQAFVLGLMRPRVYVSRALLALGDEVLAPVVAHEAVHRQKRDLVWRHVTRLLGAGQLPFVQGAIQQRLCAAQEMAADSEAAATLTDGRTRVASALLTLQRTKHTLPDPLASAAICFSEGDVAARVLTLLEPERPRSIAIGVTAVAGFSATLGLVLARESVHHTLETLLGWLS